MKVNRFVTQTSRLKAQQKAALFGTETPDFSSTSVDARSVRLVQGGGKLRDFVLFINTDDVFIW